MRWGGTHASDLGEVWTKAKKLGDELYQADSERDAAVIIYQLKLLGVSKTDMKRLLSDYSNSVERLRKSIPIGIFNKIIYTDNRQKIKELQKYIAS